MIAAHDRVYLNDHGRRSMDRSQTNPPPPRPNSATRRNAAIPKADPPMPASPTTPTKSATPPPQRRAHHPDTHAQPPGARAPSPPNPPLPSLNQPQTPAFPPPGMTRLAACLLASTLAGCAAPGCPAGEIGMLAQLYFGRTLPNGQPIDDTAWRDFLARAVTPRFPDGLTVLDGYGQWRRATGEITREPSTVVVIATDTGAVARLNAIRTEYEARFAQESVGLVTTLSCSAF